MALLKTVSTRSCLQAYKSVASVGFQQVRCASFHKRNTIILFVPQREAWVIERFGKFHKVLEPGINVIYPIVDRIRYAHNMKELTFEVPEQHAITADNVPLKIDGVLYVKIKDPYKASYGVEKPEFAIKQLAQTTMRSEIGKILLDQVFKERETLNIAIVNALNMAADDWGMECLRYEIRNVVLPEKVQEAMQMQVEAERKKRAQILESEGIREAEINVAEGRKLARILNSEANKTEQVNQAKGEAEATVAKARAKAISVALVAKALSANNGMNAVSMRVAESYVEAFSNLAKKTNTILLPSNTGDVSSMVSQAMTIYKKLATDQGVTDENVEGIDVDKFVEDELGKMQDISELIGESREMNPEQTESPQSANTDSQRTDSSQRRGRK